MIDRQRAGRRMSALVGAAAALVGAGFGVVPAASAATGHASPQVQSVSLQSSQTAVTSSTSHKLRVQVAASQTPSPAQGVPPTPGPVTVTVTNGSSGRSEFHQWSFQVDSTAFTVDSTGAGTLTVPSSEISPYGSIDLKITPIGNPTTQSCQGTPTSQTQDVSLGGTFFFDSHSTGSQAWGTVGKKAGKFTFSATNTVVWTYVNTNPAACFNFNSLPCASGLFWQSPNQQVSLSGAKVGTKGSLVGTRSTDLSTPTGATRNDEAFGTTQKLVLHRSGPAASLALTALSNSSGTAKLSAKTHGKPFSQHCTKGGKTVTETATSWSNAKYKNGTKPLKVREQIFGAIKVPNNTQATITKTSIT